MIYIEKEEKVILPRRYHMAHNIAVVCYDLIVEIGKLPKFKKLYSTSIDLTRQEQEAIGEIDKTGKLLDWLKESGRSNELNLVLSKHLFTAIVADCCSFIYESLSAARKGKLSVAYSLIRKPFTDALYLLEQLLSNRIEFIDRFYHQGDPRSYDPSHNVKKKEKFVQVIQACISQLRIHGFDAGLVYDIRYDKSLPNGLGPMMDRALHIVTNDPRYATEQGNLNFIFSHRDDFDQQWTHYYNYVPYLMIYFSAIADKVALSLLDDHDTLFERRDIRRQLALILWAPVNKRTNKVLKAFQETMPPCPKCKKRQFLSRKDYEAYFESGTLMCNECRKPYS